MRPPIPDDAWAPGGAFALEVPAEYAVVPTPTETPSVGAPVDAPTTDPRRVRLNGFAIATMVLTTVFFASRFASNAYWYIVGRGNTTLTRVEYEAVNVVISRIGVTGLASGLLGIVFAAIAMRWPGRSRVAGAICLGAGGGTVVVNLLTIIAINL